VRAQHLLLRRGGRNLQGLAELRRRQLREEARHSDEQGLLGGAAVVIRRVIAAATGVVSGMLASLSA
jgi:hypothetical protein